MRMCTGLGRGGRVGIRVVGVAAPLPFRIGRRGQGIGSRRDGGLDRPGSAPSVVLSALSQLGPTAAPSASRCRGRVVVGLPRRKLHRVLAGCPPMAGRERTGEGGVGRLSGHRGLESVGQLADPLRERVGEPSQKKPSVLRPRPSHCRGLDFWWHMVASPRQPPRAVGARCCVDERAVRPHGIVRETLRMWQARKRLRPNRLGR